MDVSQVAAAYKEALTDFMEKRSVNVSLLVLLCKSLLLLLCEIIVVYRVSGTSSIRTVYERI